MIGLRRPNLGWPVARWGHNTAQIARVGVRSGEAGVGVGARVPAKSERVQWARVGDAICDFALAAPAAIDALGADGPQDGPLGGHWLTKPHAVSHRR